MIKKIEAIVLYPNNIIYDIAKYEISMLGGVNLTTTSGEVIITGLNNVVITEYQNNKEEVVNG